MRILFLHGWRSVPGGVKPTYLKDHGHTIFNPALDDDDFDAAVRTAQAEFDLHAPDVIVGSSRGGAVAMNINSGATPFVLLCPAWKDWGVVRRLKPNSVVLHSPADDVVPFADSEELVYNSDLSPETLVSVGTDHRLADPDALRAMLSATEEVIRRSTLIERIPEMRKACDEDAKSVLPVYGIQNDSPVQDRTGVLLAIADQGFLITAAHGLKQITDAHIPLYVTSPRKGQGGIPLLGQLHATEEATIDLAVVELSNETKALLDDAGGRFLRVVDVDNQAAATPGIYLVRGYPLDCNASPMTYTTILFPDGPPINSEYQFDSTFHLLLHHSRYLQRREGQKVRSPKIVGMSGCGIWRLTSRPPFDLLSWAPEDRRLVAIQTKCKYGSFLKGTWIRHAFGLIYHRCPELRRAMSSLTFPC
jgi:hypothetical protein